MEKVTIKTNEEITYEYLNIPENLKILSPSIKGFKQKKQKWALVKEQKKEFIKFSERLGRIIAKHIDSIKDEQDLIKIVKLIDKTSKQLFGDE